MQSMRESVHTFETLTTRVACIPAYGSSLYIETSRLSRDNQHYSFKLAYSPERPLSQIVHSVWLHVSIQVNVTALKPKVAKPWTPYLDTLGLFMDFIKFDFASQLRMIGEEPLGLEQVTRRAAPPHLVHAGKWIV